MSQLPPGTLGAAVGVLIFTFLCFFANILLLWLYWKIQEPWNYVSLIGYFALLCTASSIIQQVYNYTLWTDLLWEQLFYIRKHSSNADVIFNNGNFGLMRVLAIIRLLCYIVEASYLLSYCIQVYVTLVGFWIIKKETERKLATAGRVIPVIGAVITIGLLQTSFAQRNFVVYLIIANLQSILSCSISIVLLLLIIHHFVKSKLEWKRLRSSSGSGDSNPYRPENHTATDQNAAIPFYAVRGVVFDESWLVIRLSIAVALISGFIVANIATHIPQRDDILRDAQSSEPDLSPERARSNIIGYIYGVTPGLAIWIVFGLSSGFRKIMYATFVPKRWRNNVSRTVPITEDMVNPPRGANRTISAARLEEGYQLETLGGVSKKQTW
ncbi:hypothetical protein GGR57DRAFT_364625 [Xylariaceae sp. FL1272]|nr:hypothetical protein GGR57DRAFT_364625 [Xylariaceae sp. FL1272]